jgi:hypothetical protein
MAEVIDEFWSQYRARLPESSLSAGNETVAVAAL